MNKPPVDRDQTKTRDRTRGTSMSGGCGRASMPAHGQGGHHAVSVGIISKRGPATDGSFSSSGADCLTVSPVSRLGGIAILPSHRIHIARRATLHGLSDRRPVRPSRRTGRLQFSRAVMAARRQLSVPQHLDCQVMYVPERHSHRLSSVAVFDDQQLREALTRNVGIPFQRA